MYIGCLATCGALIMSAAKMRAGESKSMNYWLRARVVLQGLTIVALVAGSMALQKQKGTEISDSADDSPPRNEAATELSKEKKRILEQQQFEERLKDAQAATEQEQGVGMMTVKGPSVNKDRRETQQPDASSSQSPISNEVKKSDGWWRWWPSSKN
jgi:Hypoxia induced protein conserved region